MRDYRKLTKKQLDVLTSVGTFGYLTTREIAQLCWPQAAPKAALKAAQEVVTDLRTDRLLLTRQLRVNGLTHAYVLTSRSAELLNDAHLQIAFSAGYNLATDRQVMRQPVLDLAHAWAKAKGLGAVGPRGLAADAWGLGAFAGLDVLLVDPDNMTPAFGVMLVRGFDVQTVERLKRDCKLSVPILLAGRDYDQRRIEALVKVRAWAAPFNEEVLQLNKPEGLLC
ncbi:MAG: hypothetical protein PHS32_20940 [Rhodoferax sp.]|uniref:hypothetical protein n=1 Tax=Rhodoferax sp. TaxID=50421 RepID=UPI002601A37C|nr:hypothetical protein [Rhodoferax sp.]MDD5336210.1 hypothetical protein [Rhodoferax sp.]